MSCAREVGLFSLVILGGFLKSRFSASKKTIKSIHGEQVVANQIKLMW